MAKAKAAVQANFGTKSAIPAAVLLLLLVHALTAAARPGSNIFPQNAALSYAPGTVLLTSGYSGPMDLLQALGNTSVKEVVLDVSFIPMSNVLKAIKSVVVSRNVTVLSISHPPTVLDLEFSYNKIMLAPHVTVTFQNLVIANDRKLGGLALDVFMGSGPTSRIVMQDVWRVKAVCFKPETAVQLAYDSHVQPGQPQHNVTIFNSSVCISIKGQQRCYQHDLHLWQHSMFLDAAELGTLISAEHDDVGDRIGKDGLQNTGYQLIQRNVFRLCDHFYSESCLAMLDQIECWSQAMEQGRYQQQMVDDSQRGITANDALQQQLSPGVISGISVALGAVGAGAAVFLTCIYIKRSAAIRDKQSRAKQGQLLQDTSEAGTRLRGNGASCSSLGSGGQHAAAILSPLRNLRLGPLLGAGSFGRVYKGHWNSLPVAVKVMSCRPDNLHRVLQEAEIMMELKHPFIARALTCAVKHHTTTGHDADTTAEGIVSTYKNISYSRVVTSDTINKANPRPLVNSRDQPSTPPARPSAVLADVEAEPNSGRKTHLAAGCNVNSSHRATSSHEISIALSGGEDSLNAARAATATAGKEKPLLASAHYCQDASTDVSIGSRSNCGSGANLADDANLADVVPAAAAAISAQEAASPSAQDRNATQLQPDQTTHTEHVEVWLVLELCTGGNLKDHISLAGDCDQLKWAGMLSHLLEVAQGMDYMHGLGVLHGDLKAANILLHKSIQGSYGRIAKISDFGMAAVLLDGASHRNTLSTGTVTHSAPEVFLEGRLSPASDVYSFGVMMWELFTNSTAFAGWHTGMVVERVCVHQERPPLTPELRLHQEYCLLMTACWQQDPGLRPSFAQVVQCLALMLDHLGSLTPDASPATADQHHGVGAAGASQVRVFVDQQMDHSQPLNSLAGGMASSSAVRRSNNAEGHDILVDDIWSSMKLLPADVRGGAAISNGAADKGRPGGAAGAAALNQCCPLAGDKLYASHQVAAESLAHSFSHQGRRRPRKTQSQLLVGADLAEHFCLQRSKSQLVLGAFPSSAKANRPWQYSSSQSMHLALDLGLPVRGLAAGMTPKVHVLSLIAAQSSSFVTAAAAAEAPPPGGTAVTAPVQLVAATTGDPAAARHFRDL